MTINDTDLNAYCLKIRQLSEQLPKLMRDGRDTALALVIAEIEATSRDAGFRLNDVTFKDRWHPYRDSMGG
jgi:hypothetical protein